MWPGRAPFVALALLSCVEQTPDTPTKEDLRLIAQNVLKEAPKARYPVSAELEDKVVYLGLDAPESVAPGRAIKLVHYWKVVRAVADDWKVFVHLNGTGRQGYVNADHAPIKGRYPVARWKAGEIIRDEHSVTLPRGWKADQVEVYVGLWRGADRMKIAKGPSDGKGRVLAARIPIVRDGAAQDGVVKDGAPARKRYAARKLEGAIIVDGALSEDAWQKAASTGPFVNTLTGEKVDSGVSAKVVWDAQNLYVAFDVEDRDVSSTLKKHDDKLWTQDAVEMFIDADGDGKDYLELQVSPAGVTFDSFLPDVRKNQNDWESGMKAAVKVDGTLNKPGDVDKGWTVEIAIPLAAASGGAAGKTIKAPGEPGAVWRVNWFRMDGQGAQQKAAGWSPPLVGDFHAIGRFGELRFVDPSRRAPGISPGAVEALRTRAAKKAIPPSIPPAKSAP